MSEVANSVPRRHPKGLYLLFFTEMAERFSYYGMRALFTLYLVAAFFDSSMASQIYGSYTGLVYLTPLLGGYIADRYWGNRRSIIVGGLVMALGQFLMFLSACTVKQSILVEGAGIDPSVNNTLSTTIMFAGLVALILGNGFFKPNISTMVGDLYEPTDKRKDAAFTIFYMGINVGAFIAPLVCSTIGEGKWNDLEPFKWGFLAACIAMIFSVVVFVTLKDTFLVTPDGLGIGLPPKESKLRQRKEKLEQEEAVRDVAEAAKNEAAEAEPAPGDFAAEIAAKEREAEARDPEPLSVAAEKNIENEEKSAADAEIASVAETVEKPKNSPLRLIGCATGAVTLFTLFALAAESFNDYISAAIYAISIALPVFIITDRTLSRVEKSRIGVIYIIAVFVIFFWSAFEQAGSSLTIFADQQVQRQFGDFEFKTGWFQSINPIVVVTFAPLMALLWQFLGKRGIEPASPVKQAIGLLLLSIGYFVIAFATHGVEPGVKVAMFWLVALYFIHTMGELCLSPIGLSMVNKLAPAHLASLLMGVWFMSNAASNILAGKLATLLPDASKGAGEAVKTFLGFEIATLDAFFLVFAIMAGGASLLLFALSPLLKKMMKGIQ